jgi:hypothetical protein
MSISLCAFWSRHLIENENHFGGAVGPEEDLDVLFRVHQGPGAFYRLMPHNLMALLFGGTFLFAVLAITMGARAFWLDANPMGVLLAIHLGVVFALFVTMPYGRFLHGIYRSAALVPYAMERKAEGS